MTRLMYATTSPITFNILMAGHLHFMKNAGLDVTAVASPGTELDMVAKREQIEVAAVPMRRELSPVSDLLALIRLLRLMRSSRPDIVNAGTPKAGLLCMLASRAVRVPVRVYTLRGLKSETAGGWRRRLLDLAERVASRCATDVICVSPSLRSLCLERALVAPEKVRVVGHGSSNGVDLDRFHTSTGRRRAARAALEMDDDRPIVGFVGRLVVDKGVKELVAAMTLVREQVPQATLLLAGPFEEGDPVDTETRRQIACAAHIVHLGRVDEVADLYPAFDVLAFPSAREGLPNAPLEAAANAIPTVGFDATGTRDVILDGETGRLVAQGDVTGLADALVAYLKDSETRVAHGEAALKRVADRFERYAVWTNLLDFYRSKIGVAGPDLAGGAGW